MLLLSRWIKRLNKLTSQKQRKKERIKNKKKKTQFMNVDVSIGGAVRLVSSPFLCIPTHLLVEGVPGGPNSGSFTQCPLPLS